MKNRALLATMLVALGVSAVARADMMAHMSVWQLDAGGRVAPGEAVVVAWGLPMGPGDDVGALLRAGFRSSAASIVSFPAIHVPLGKWSQVKLAEGAHEYEFNLSATEPLPTLVMNGKVARVALSRPVTLTISHVGGSSVVLVGGGDGKDYALTFVVTPKE